MAGRHRGTTLHCSPVWGLWAIWLAPLFPWGRDLVGHIVSLGRLELAVKMILQHLQESSLIPNFRRKDNYVKPWQLLLIIIFYVPNTVLATLHALSHLISSNFIPVITQRWGYYKPPFYRIGNGILWEFRVLTGDWKPQNCILTLALSLQNRAAFLQNCLSQIVLPLRKLALN